MPGDLVITVGKRRGNETSQPNIAHLRATGEQPSAHTHASHDLILMLNPKTVSQATDTAFCPSLPC